MREFSSAFESCPTLLDLYTKLRVVGRNGKVFEEIGAASTERNLLAIRNLMHKCAPSATLEIGMAFGGSTLAIASIFAELGDSPRGQHIAIDPFQSTFWDDAGMLQIELAGLCGFIRHIDQPSAITLPLLVKQSCSFDMIYVDGSHLFEDVFCDAYFSRQLLRVGGFLLFDDAADAHVAKVLRFFRSNWSGCLEEVNPREYLIPGRREQGRELLRRFAGRRQLAVFRLTKREQRPWDASLNRF